MVALGGTLLGDYTTRASLATSSEGSILTLALAKLGDSGSYKCELALGEDRPGVTHTVTVKGEERSNMNHYTIPNKDY